VPRVRSGGVAGRRAGCVNLRAFTVDLDGAFRHLEDRCTSAPSLLRQQQYLAQNIAGGINAEGTVVFTNGSAPRRWDASATRTTPVGWSPGAASAISDRGSAAQRWEQRSAWGARSSGHSYNGHQPIAEQLPDDPLFRSYRAMLEKRHGVERTKKILTPRRHNTAFYPNMTLQALNQHIRVIVPVSVDRTEVHVYPVMLKGAPDEMNRSSVRHLNMTHSAASLIQTDDLECFRRCQDGMNATGSDWVWFARGVDTDKEDEHGDLVNTGTGEIQQRAQYTAWLRLMSAEG